MKTTMQDTKQYKLTKFSPIHPLIFAVIPIVFLFSNNVSYLEIDEIIFPIVTSLGITCIVFFILSKIILKNSLKSGMIVSTGVILFFFYGHVYNEISHLDIFGFDITWHSFLIPMFLFVLGIITIISIRSKSDFRNITVIFNIVVLTMLIFPVINITSFYVEQYSSNETSFDPLVTTDSNLILEELPNVYYIVLDGYPDAKTLERVYNFDNNEFLTYLNEKGFFVPDESRSNYGVTVFSITSTLNMQYLIDHSKYGPDESLERGISLDTKKMLWDNKVMKLFEEKGYHTISFKSGYKPIDLISAAQSTECEGGKGPLGSRLMVMLADTSMLKFMHVKLYEKDKKNDILCAFDSLKKVSTKHEQPIFAFAHVMIPHPPYLFDKNGVELTPETLDLESQRWDSHLYAEQVQFGNKKLKETIESILNSQDDGRESVIILQGDHGTKTGYDKNNITYEGVMNNMSILNAYHLPGIESPEEFIGDKTSSVNTFRIISNIYLDQNYPLLDNRSYVYVDEQVKFTDVTEIMPSQN